MDECCARFCAPPPAGDAPPPDPRGGAVQVDPMRLTLRPTGTKRLKLKCDVLLSTSAFKFNLRRYPVGWSARRSIRGGWLRRSSPGYDWPRLRSRL